MSEHLIKIIYRYMYVLFYADFLLWYLIYACSLN